MTEHRTIAILGGTGALGSGLAARLGSAGHTVLIFINKHYQSDRAGICITGA